MQNTTEYPHLCISRFLKANNTIHNVRPLPRAMRHLQTDFKSCIRFLLSIEDISLKKHYAKLLFLTNGSAWKNDNNWNEGEYRNLIRSTLLTLPSKETHLSQKNSDHVTNTTHEQSNVVKEAMQNRKLYHSKTNRFTLITSALEKNDLPFLISILTMGGVPYIQDSIIEHNVILASNRIASLLNNPHMHSIKPFLIWLIRPYQLLQVLLSLYDSTMIPVVHRCSNEEFKQVFRAHHTKRIYTALTQPRGKKINLKASILYLDKDTEYQLQKINNSSSPMFDFNTNPNSIQAQFFLPAMAVLQQWNTLLSISLTDLNLFLQKTPCNLLKIIENSVTLAQKKLSEKSLFSCFNNYSEQYEFLKTLCALLKQERHNRILS